MRRTDIRVMCHSCICICVRILNWARMRGLRFECVCGMGSGVWPLISESRPEWYEESCDL